MAAETDAASNDNTFQEAAVSELVQVSANQATNEQDLVARNNGKKARRRKKAKKGRKGGTKRGKKRGKKGKKGKKNRGANGAAANSCKGSRRAK